MKFTKDFIFVIPARKGSKGIKNKNIIKIKNKTLIEYTFETLKKISKYRKFLISDSKKIKKIADKYEINTEYKRHRELSKDNTMLIDNLIHFDKFIDDKIKFQHYVILQPTSPLRKYNDIIGAIKIYLKKNSYSLFSISPSLEHPNESIFFKKKKLFFFNRNTGSLRQNYKKSYFINGSIYIFNRKLLKNRKIISNFNHSTYLMTKKKSIDLDDYQDLEIVKKLL